MSYHEPDVSLSATAFKWRIVKPASFFRGASSWLSVAALSGGMTLCAGLQDAHAEKAEPFKITNIHFETNSSACDMGIQIFFDTDGVSDLTIEDPNGEVVYSSEAPGDEETDYQTEGFQERVEPPITDLEDALGCDPSDDAISLEDLLEAWPQGFYTFEANSGETEFESKRKLTYRIPAGPEIIAPLDGAVVSPLEPLIIEWEPVTGPIIPTLGPVQITGYHILMKNVTNVTEVNDGPLLANAFDVDVPSDATSVEVPAAYLEPGQIYEFEVLATDKSSNQTITEGGAVCTLPTGPGGCELP